MEQNQSPLVSVIVPVWNPGPGITRCIESLRNQTLKEIEMIFVDDCGTDDSMDNVRAAAKDDSRIRIIENEKNIGAGPSRNKGIEAARGEYLSFVDPDDYVAPDFLELLYTEAHKHSFDIVKGCISYINEDGSTFVRDRELNKHIRKGLLANKALYTLFTYEHHSAIYRKELLLTKGIRYGTSSRAQDSTFLLKVCSQAESFSIIDHAHYCFCARPDSVMHTMDTIRLQGYLRAISEQVNYVRNNIPQDDESIGFLHGLFLGGLRELSRYDSFPEMKDVAQNYLLDLQKEMERANLPLNPPFTLRVLRDHAIALPSSPYYSPWEGKNPPIRYAKLVERWVDYYLAHPKEDITCWKELRNLIITANKAALGKPHSTYAEKEQKQGRILLNQQIKRLPSKLQIQINALMVKHKVKHIIHDVLGRL